MRSYEKTYGVNGEQMRPNSSISVDTYERYDFIPSFLPLFDSCQSQRPKKESKKSLHFSTLKKKKKKKVTSWLPRLLLINLNVVKAHFFLCFHFHFPLLIYFLSIRNIHYHTLSYTKTK